MLDWVLLIRLAAPWLSVDGCAEVEADRLVELTELALGDGEVEGRVALRCDEDVFVVQVQRDDGTTAQRSIARTEAVTDAPERYLALELAEFLDASAYKEPAVPPPEPEPEPEPEPVSSTATPPGPSRRGFVAVAGRFEAGGSPFVPAGGGAIIVGGEVVRGLSLRADVSGLAGARSVGPDAVRSMAVWGGGAVLGTLDFSRAIVHIGAGARVGGVWFRGLPAAPSRSGHTHGGLTWSPLARVGVLGKVGARLAIMASIDAGWALRPIRGQLGSETLVSSGGAWMGVNLGLATLFGG